jgi:hypothetical protein
MGKLTDEQALAIARKWVDAWNSHDIDRIMSHYADDAVLTSPLVERILGGDRTCVRGNAELRSYFHRGLEAFPELRFNLWRAYPGQDSVVVNYESVRGLRAAEYMRLDASGRVREVVAHYAAPLNEGA